MVSQNIKPIDTHVLGQIFTIYLGQQLSLTQPTPSLLITHVYVSCLIAMSLLSHYGTSAPWGTLDIEQAELE